MGKTRIIIGTHNHLPLGRSERGGRAAVPGLAEALPRRALPLPGFPVTLHYSGILMEWLEESHPELLTLLGEMVGRGQVEVLGGGYYDPILPLIPMNDKLGQLEKMTTWLRVRFETRPRGCWIVEKIWEQSLASVLRASGMDYTFVDDGQFAIAGVDGDGPVHAVHHRRPGKDHLRFFPFPSGSRELAAQEDPRAAMEFLRCRAAEAEDRAGRAGRRPHGGRGNGAGSLLRDGWLEAFIRLAEENADWLEPTTPGLYLKDNPPARRLFIPSSSSLEIMRRALPPVTRARPSRVPGRR